MQIFARLKDALRGARYAGLLVAVLASLHMTPCRASDDDIEVNVTKHGDEVTIDLQFLVHAKKHEVWTVLTDYDHMTEFLSNLHVSHILEQHGNHWRVEQKGASSRAGVTFSFESIREVDLTPEEHIASKVVGGTIKRLEAQTSLFTRGEETRVEYHSVSVPNVWLPPVIGTSILESEARKQFGEMRAEILRRKALEKQ